MPLILVVEPTAPHVRLAEVVATTDAEERRLLSLWRRVTPAINTALGSRRPASAGPAARERAAERVSAS